MTMVNDPEPASPKGSEPTRHIPEKETLRLWVCSGGRCAICNKYLHEEPYFERPINLGERAHIAGWTDAPGSPRGDSALPLSERNKADNLVLLCQDCHTIVDNAETRGDYPEERLLEIKREHEERVRHLTGMAKDRDTAVLRVFGLIRGSMPELARDAALRTVVDAAGRYARFPLAPDRHSIEIDLSGLPDPEELADGGDAYWRLGRIRIDSAAARIADYVQGEHIKHLSVFALARIPLLVYLGYSLDDKVPADLYQKHRGGTEGWAWPEDGPSESFEIIERRGGPTDGDVAVILSISGTVPLG